DVGLEARRRDRAEVHHRVESVVPLVDRAQGVDNGAVVGELDPGEPVAPWPRDIQSDDVVPPCTQLPLDDAAQLAAGSRDRNPHATSLPLPRVALLTPPLDAVTQRARPRASSRAGGFDTPPAQRARLLNPR